MKYHLFIGVMFIMILGCVMSQPIESSISPTLPLPSLSTTVETPAASTSSSADEPTSPAAATAADKCTPFEKPTPLSPFDVAKLSGVWYEIATSSLPRATDEQSCVCSFMNFTAIPPNPQAQQTLEGRTVFDLYASCNKLTPTGDKVRKIGQAIQIDATTDKSSFEMFMVEAKLQNGQLVPVPPPAGSPGQPSSAQPAPTAVPTPRGQAPRANPQRPAARAPVRPSGPPPSLKEMLNPNLVTLKVLGSGAQYTHAIMAGPCQEAVWIMSRNKSISDDIYKSLLAAATAAGIDVTAIGLSFTSQDGCAAPSFP